MAAAGLLVFFNVRRPGSLVLLLWVISLSEAKAVMHRRNAVSQKKTDFLIKNGGFLTMRFKSSVRPGRFEIVW